MVAYSFKERFVAPIEVGLGREITGPSLVDFPAPKLQTIRAHGKRRHARPGDVLQLYYAMRTKVCRLIGVAKCRDVRPIIIYPDTMAMLVDGKIQTAKQIKLLSLDDGFLLVEDMQNFWLEEHGPHKFEGVLIRWQPITGEP